MPNRPLQVKYLWWKSAKPTAVASRSASRHSKGGCAAAICFRRTSGVTSTRFGLAGLGGAREHAGVTGRRVVGTSEANPATDGPILARRPRFEKCWREAGERAWHRVQDDSLYAGGASTSCRRG